MLEFAQNIVNSFGGDTVARYKNLMAEMARNGIKVEELANILHCTRQNVYSKLRGETNFSLADINAIQSYINSHSDNGNYTIDYLFKDED